MGRLTRVAVVVGAVVVAGGCASIAGLDGINEQGCAPNCGADASVDSPGGGDSSSKDAPGGDVERGDAGGDSGKAKDAKAADGPVESSCGALNSNDNCSACGDKCAGAATGQQAGTCAGPSSGQGATCEYKCSAGWLDCNAKTKPPDLDGCECSAPGATLAQCCSGGACPVMHEYEKGVTGTTFYDCETMVDSQLAEDACRAYLAQSDAGSAKCAAYNECGDAGTKEESWCSGAATGDCLCWFYTGSEKGMYLDPAAYGIPDPSQCYCGVSSGSYD